MTRLEIAVEAMKVLLPTYSKPMFMYDSDAVTKVEAEKIQAEFTGTFNLSGSDSIKQVAPNYKFLAEQCFAVADAMVAEYKFENNSETGKIDYLPEEFDKPATFLPKE